MSLRKSKKERISRYIWLVNHYCFSGSVEYDRRMKDSLIKDLLTELGYEEVVSAYRKVGQKRYAKSL